MFILIIDNENSFQLIQISKVVSVLSVVFSVAEIMNVHEHYGVKLTR